MDRSLRQILADSHVAAVAIAVLLLWSLDATFRAAWEPGYGVLHYLLTAVLILDIPAFSRTLTFSDRMMLMNSILYLCSALIYFAAAWLLARWVYSVRPIQVLKRYQDMIRRNDV